MLIFASMLPALYFVETGNKNILVRTFTFQISTVNCNTAGWCPLEKKASIHV